MSDVDDCDRLDNNVDDRYRDERDEDHAVQPSIVSHSFPLSPSPFASFTASLPLSPVSPADDEYHHQKQKEQQIIGNIK